MNNIKIIGKNILYVGLILYSMELLIGGMYGLLCGSIFTCYDPSILSRMITIIIFTYRGIINIIINSNVIHLFYLFMLSILINVFYYGIKKIKYILRLI